MVKELNVGDEVCVKPTSYVNLSKNFFNSIDRWCNSNANTDSLVMLGGNYPIRSVVSQGGRVWYSLLSSAANNTGLVSAGEVVPLSEKRRCPFRPGDIVKFNSIFSKQDLAFLVAAFGGCYKGFDFEKNHEVTDVLNDLYVFLDYGKTDPCAFPFLHDDVLLAAD